MERIELDTARGKKRVPPGQYLVGDRWPILTYGSTPQFDPKQWDFTVGGLVENPLRFTWEEWNELPTVEVKADMHCVTSWSKLDNVWMGVRAKTILEMAKPKPEARFFSVFCDGGYTTN
ncbi:MAG: molybdopterin-dependent oxidoreductase, partial [Actinomycetota bacterium]|nr:molybdopterin-dependent oxidoreductase [Actinomycetota bacterium]